jgi:hypothetical protein
VHVTRFTVFLRRSADYLKVVDSLDVMLKRAAAADAWTHVVHRCAWCQRVVDAHGEYANAACLDSSTVVTDGMCPACGTQALAQLALRRAPFAA